MTASPETVSTETVPSPVPEVTRRTPLPEIEPEPTGPLAQFLVGVFVVVPLLALLAAIPLAWGWGLGWHDIVIALVFYVISGLGISMGFHRYFTHCSFKANRALRDRAGHRGQPGHRGPGADLGRRPPPAPQVQRPGGRPALAVAVRQRLEGAGQGPGLRAHGLAVRPQPHLAGEVLPRPAGRPTMRRISRPFPLLVAVSLLAPGADRRPVVDVPGRARSPRSSGPAWSGSPCCTT